MTSKPGKIFEPTKPEDYIKLGDSHFKAGNHQLAMRCYERAINTDNNHRPAWKRKRKTGITLENWHAVTECSVQLAKLEPKRADQWYKNAAKANKKAIKLHPTIPNLWKNMSSLYIKLGRYSKAAYCYQKNAKIDSKNKEQWLARAIECYDKITNEHPDLADIWAKKATAHKKLGNTKDLALCYVTLIGLDPRNKSWETSLSHLYNAAPRAVPGLLYRAGRNNLDAQNYELALTYFGKVFEHAPAHKGNLLYKAKAHRTLEEHTDAAECYEMLAILNKKHAAEWHSYSSQEKLAPGEQEPKSKTPEKESDTDSKTSIAEGFIKTTIIYTQPDKKEAQKEHAEAPEPPEKGLEDTLALEFEEDEYEDWGYVLEKKKPEIEFEIDTEWSWTDDTLAFECPECGTGVTETDAHCTGCGIEFEPEPEEEDWSLFIKQKPAEYEVIEEKVVEDAEEEDWAQYLTSDGPEEEDWSAPPQEELTLTPQVAREIKKALSAYKTRKPLQLFTESTTKCHKCSHIVPHSEPVCPRCGIKLHFIT